jgi:superfamily II DNA or RNA helicase
MELYPFQVEFVRKIYAALKSGVTKLGCIAPTGAGKTVVMGRISQHAHAKGRRILILVHMDVLVPQTLDKLRKFGIEDIGCIKNGYPENREAWIQVASLQTLARRKWWKECHFDLVMYDEAHITLFSGIGLKIRHEYFADATILGFTATPRRLSKREGLSDHLDDSVLAATPSQLQELGLLSKMKYYAFTGVDVSKVRIQAGDFHQSDLQVACANPALVQDMVKHWKNLVPGKSTLGFCVSIDHAIAVRDAFREQGIPSEVVTGDTPRKERSVLYNALDRGDIQVLTSVNVVSIGFDLPSVEVGLGLRPTKSWALHMQQIGRIMRICEGKELGYWLDQAGNVMRHGLPEDLTEDDYKMDKGKESDGQDPPYKICPECDHVNYAFAKICPECGFEFPPAEKIITPGEFIEYFVPEKDRPATEKFYRKKLKEAYRKGYDPAWAAFKFQEEYGYFPTQAWRLNAIFSEDTDLHRKAYFDYLTAIQEAKRKDNTWVMQNFMKEFGKESKQWCISQLFDKIEAYMLG